MFGHRFLRVTVAAGLLSSAGLALYPHVFTYVSTSAVVNAPVLTLRSPFDGIIAQASGPISEVFSSNQEIFAVQEDRADYYAMANLEARMTTIEGEMAALDKQRSQLAQIRSTLRERQETHATHANHWLRAREAETEARIDATAARFHEAEAAVERQRRLADVGALTRVSLRNAETDAAVARSLVAAERANLSRLGVARQALKDGVPLNEGGEGLAYIASRLDDIELQVVDLDRRRATLEAEGSGLGFQISTTHQRSLDREVFAPISPFAGII